VPTFGWQPTLQWQPQSRQQPAEQHEMLSMHAHSYDWQRCQPPCGTLLRFASARSPPHALPRVARVPGPKVAADVAAQREELPGQGAAGQAKQGNRFKLALRHVGVRLSLGGTPTNQRRARSSRCGKPEAVEPGSAAKARLLNSFWLLHRPSACLPKPATKQAAQQEVHPACKGSQCAEVSNRSNIWLGGSSCTARRRQDVAACQGELQQGRGLPS